MSEHFLLTLTVPHCEVAFLASSRFLLISAKPHKCQTMAKLIELSTRNLQYLLGHPFYTLCANKISYIPTIGWPQMTSEWRHVRAILMQNKGHQESLSWTQLWSFNQLLCRKWRRIDRPTELPFRIFENFEKQNTIRQIFAKNWNVFTKLLLKKRNACYKTHEMNNFLENLNLVYQTMTDLYDILFFCIWTFRSSVKCA